MQGQIFSTDFLLRGVRDTPAWQEFSEHSLDAFAADLRKLFSPYGAESALNEGQTEGHLIEPIINLSGWRDAWTSQINLSQSGREDVPDFPLLSDADTLARAIWKRSNEYSA